jgi:Cu-Zn family superoxide dismutase
MVGTLFLNSSASPSGATVSVDVATYAYGDLASPMNAILIQVPDGFDIGSQTIETSVKATPVCSTASSCIVTFNFSKSDWCGLIGKGVTISSTIGGVSSTIKSVFGLGNLSVSSCPFARSYNTQPAYAAVKLVPVGNSVVSGSVVFALVGGSLSVSGSVSGLTPGMKHGVHVHGFGDTRDVQRALASGSHFAFSGQVHGLVDNSSRHSGDLGNIVADNNGVAVFKFEVPNNMEPQRALTLLATNGGAVGRSIIVHIQTDDGITQPIGNSGSRVAQGVIGYSKFGASPPPAPPSDAASDSSRSAVNAGVIAGSVLGSIALAIACKPWQPQPCTKFIRI